MVNESELVSLIEDANQRIKSVRGGVAETVAPYSYPLSDLLGCDLHLKCEHLQATGSFKFRGALSKLTSLTDEARSRGVLTASTGNHGLGVALAAKLLNVQATVYAPENASQLKLQSITKLGAEVVKVAGGCLEAELKAKALATQASKTYISPYNDVMVMAGQGSIGIELNQQIPNLDAVFVSVGGGGLIGGVGTYLKSKNPQIKVVGAWAKNSPVAYKCLQAGRIIKVEESETLSDATMGEMEPGSVTFPICQRVIDHQVLASEDEIKYAMKLIAANERWIVEGAAGLALAALIKTADQYRNKRVAAIMCGRNIDFDKFRKATS